MATLMWVIICWYSQLVQMRSKSDCTTKPTWNSDVEEWPKIRLHLHQKIIDDSTEDKIKNCSHVRLFTRFDTAMLYPEIRAVSLLSSLGGSTGSKTLCMPGDGESRGSSPRFNNFFFLFFQFLFLKPGMALVATVSLDMEYFHGMYLITRCFVIEDLIGAWARDEPLRDTSFAAWPLVLITLRIQSYHSTCILQLATWPMTIEQPASGVSVCYAYTPAIRTRQP